MNEHRRVGVAVTTLAAIFNSAILASQSHAVTRKIQSPGWFLHFQSPSVNISEQGSCQRGRLAACMDDFAKYSARIAGERACLVENIRKLYKHCIDTIIALQAASTEANRRKLT
jgi:hypothetical protein